MVEVIEACERCEETKGVKIEDSRTAYHWDGKGDDPNRPLLLCRSCANEHHAHWDERWDEYYSGCM